MKYAELTNILNDAIRYYRTSVNNVNLTDFFKKVYAEADELRINYPRPCSS